MTIVSPILKYNCVNEFPTQQCDPPALAFLLRTQNCSLAKELLKQQLLLALYFFVL